MLRLFKSTKVEPVAQSHQLRAQVDTSIETRSETLLGKEYLVVPVVAMVEGVRLGANADAPELGLSTEFSKDIIMWANRPLVMNHPQTELDGEMIYCSANTPDILEQYAFGMTMNPYVEDSKLKMEAWIDKARVLELGGEFSDIVDLIEAQETVEVSVGFFSTLESKKGKFRGQSYSGIWRNIKPDHLAILSIGTLGACSIEDGCGIPRINQQEAAVATSVPQIKVDASDCGCGCGGKGDCHTHDHAHDAPSTTETELTTPQSTEPSTPEVEDTPEAMQLALQSEADRTEIRNFMSQVVAQSISADLMDRDVGKLISKTLRDKYPSSDTYLVGFTAEKAIFESYMYHTGRYGYRTFQIAINVTESACEFVGEAEEVVLLTKIVPQTAMPAVGRVFEALSKTNPTEENDMSGQHTQQPDPSTTAPAITTPEAAPVAQAAATPAAPMTVQAYIESAPLEMREVLQASLNLHASKKSDLVAKLVANKSNKFSEDQLKAFDLGMLENLAALAGEVITPNYSGVAAPVVHQTQTSEAVPAPPKLFAKPANAA